MFVVGDRVTHLKTKVVMFVEGVSRAGDFYKCRYRHNGSWSYDTFPEEELMLEHREPVIALACLNQHPEHDWSSEKNLYLTNHHFTIGSPVEVCSRPGCGLIRVRQEKMTDPGEAAMSGEFYSRSDRPRTFAVIDEAVGIEDEVYEKAQEWAKKKVEVVGSLPQSGDPYPPGWESGRLGVIEDEQVRCERCQCLTPVSELSRDAQGRMVCKHH